MTRDEALTILGYAIGMNPGADVLKARFQVLAQSTHPDKVGGSAEAFERVRAAYEWLKNPPLEPSIRARLEKDLAQLRRQLVNIDATVIHWRGDDPRIPGMKGPVEEHIAKIEQELERPVA